MHMLSQQRGFIKTSQASIIIAPITPRHITTRDGRRRFDLPHFRPDVQRQELRATTTAAGVHDRQAALPAYQILRCV
eukprot:SAG11_NODE_29229_length_313_cov_0.724299_1_plen_76_part_01